MKALFQVATGECATQLELTRVRHQGYCNEHGYRYVVYEEQDLITDPYYAKLFFIRELILSGYSEIVCLDADVIIQDLSAAFSDVIAGPQEIYVAECEIVKGDYSTGVMVIRNTGRALNFINAVLEFGKQHRTLACDQGAFNAIAKYVVEYQGLVCRMERKWNSLYNNGEEDKTVVAFHGAQNKLEEMQKYMEMLEGE